MSRHYVPKITPDNFGPYLILFVCFVFLNFVKLYGKLFYLTNEKKVDTCIIKILNLIAIKKNPGKYDLYDQII